MRATTACVLTGGRSSNTRCVVHNRHNSRRGGNGHRGLCSPLPRSAHPGIRHAVPSTSRRPARGSARRGRGVIVTAKSCASTSTATSTARASRSSGGREARAVAGTACWALYACPDAGRRVSAGRRSGHLERAASSRMTPRRARPLDATACCLAVRKEIDWICPTVNSRSIRETGSGRSSGRTRSAVALGSFTYLSSVGAGSSCALGQ